MGQVTAEERVVGAHAAGRAGVGRAPGVRVAVLAAGFLLFCAGMALCFVPRVLAGEPLLRGSLYGALVFTYLGSQMVLAHLEHRRRLAAPELSARPAVSVVIPAFNEPWDVLRRTVESVHRQVYDGSIEIFVIDDGSSEPHSLAGRTFGLADSDLRRVEVVVLPANRGKRKAQYEGFVRASADYVVTVDSDVVLAPDALARLMSGIVGQPEVGAVTGMCRVANKQNLLTRLLDLRYWAAGNQERAAQSYLGVMICCTGAFSCYRREIVDRVKDRYIGQRFLGRECTFGDDRHLTNLVLWEGYETGYVDDAECWTNVPETLVTWLRQQRRWSQSFYRELLWSLAFAHRKNLYFVYSLVAGAVLPLLLLGALLRATWHVALGGPAVAVPYVGTIVGMSMLRGIYAIWRTGDAAFLMMPLYGVIHLVLVFPVRIWAVLTLWNTRWGTR